MIAPRAAATLLLTLFLSVATACGAGAGVDNSAGEESTANRAPAETSTSTAERHGAEIAGGEKLVTEGRAGVAVSEGGVVLVRLKPSEGSEVFLDAAYSGKLLVDKAGCSRLDAPRGYTRDYLPVWPTGYSLDKEDSGTRVLEEKGRAVGEVGKDVTVGGGEIT